MRFGVRFSAQGFKATTCLWLFALMLLPPAGAVSFLGVGKKKEEPIQALPPVMDASPTINPHEPAPSKAPEEGDKTSADQVDDGPTATAMPVDPTQTLIDQKVYPEAWKERDTALSRAELADVLTKALKHNVNMVSEFPFYRDVPKDYWAYNAIEAARAKKLLDYPNDHGFYHPDSSVTFEDVFMGIANAITGKPPSEDETSFYLVIYPDWEDIPEELWPSVAKMTRARFFEHQLSPALQLSEEPTPEAIAPYVVALSHLNERRILLPPSKENLLPYIPGGLTVTISPAVAIFESRLAVGEAVYFSLVDAADQLPKGSKIRGVVKDVLGSHTYAIELTEAETPEEKTFRLSAEFEMVFKNKTLPFIVPGETMTATTRLPSNVKPVQGPPPFTPPAGQKQPVKLSPSPSSQAGSSSNTAAPSSVPRSPK